MSTLPRDVSSDCDWHDHRSMLERPTNRYVYRTVFASNDNDNQRRRLQRSRDCVRPFCYLPFVDRLLSLVVAAIAPVAVDTLLALRAVSKATYETMRPMFRLLAHCLSETHNNDCSLFRFATLVHIDTGRRMCFADIRRIPRLRRLDTTSISTCRDAWVGAEFPFRFCASRSRHDHHHHHHRHHFIDMSSMPALDACGRNPFSNLRTRADVAWALLRNDDQPRFAHIRLANTVRRNFTVRDGVPAAALLLMVNDRYISFVNGGGGGDAATSRDVFTYRVDRCNGAVYFVDVRYGGPFVSTLGASVPNVRVAASLGEFLHRTCIESAIRYKWQAARDTSAPRPPPSMLRCRTIVARPHALDWTRIDTLQLLDDESRRIALTQCEATYLRAQYYTWKRQQA